MTESDSLPDEVRALVGDAGASIDPSMTDRFVAAFPRSDMVVYRSGSGGVLLYDPFAHPDEVVTSFESDADLLGKFGLDKEPESWRDRKGLVALGRDFSAVFAQVSEEDLRQGLRRSDGRWVRPGEESEDRGPWVIGFRVAGRGWAQFVPERDADLRALWLTLGECLGVDWVYVASSDTSCSVRLEVFRGAERTMLVHGDEGVGGALSSGEGPEERLSYADVERRIRAEIVRRGIQEVATPHSTS